MAKEHRYMGHMRAALQLGIALTEAKILSFLLENIEFFDDKSAPIFCTITGITRHMKITRESAYIALRKLQKRGWIEVKKESWKCRTIRLTEKFFDDTKVDHVFTIM